MNTPLTKKRGCILQHIMNHARAEERLPGLIHLPRGHALTQVATMPPGPGPIASQQPQQQLDQQKAGPASSTQLSASPDSCKWPADLAAGMVAANRVCAAVLGVPIASRSPTTAGNDSQQAIAGVEA